MLATDLVQALDAVAFARQALNIEPDPWQRDVLRSPSRRTLLNCSRQSGKSTIAAVLALHKALFQPSSLVLIVSPSLRQSSEMYRKVTGLARSLPQPPAMREDTKTSCTLENHSRIVSLPSSEATVRGYSAVSLLVFDEASRVDDALYRACRPMVAVSGGAIVAMSTPWGKRGWWYEAWESGAADWARTQITAYDCPRISATFLEEERRTLGALWFASEYECRFTETIDSVFTHDDIQAAISTEVLPLFERMPA
jgi:hypothetical protein